MEKSNKLKTNKMKKYYTVKDVATGAVAIKFKKDASRLNNIIKLAFPNDPNWVHNMVIKESDLIKGDRFYLESIETELEGVPCFWWANGNCTEIDLPTVSEKYILLPGESVPEEFTLDEIWLDFAHSTYGGTFIQFIEKGYNIKIKKK